jgi:hypothetical protein
MASLYKDFELRPILRYDVKIIRKLTEKRKKRSVMRRIARWLVVMIFLSLATWAGPLTLVVGGEADRDDALALRDRLVHLLPRPELRERVGLREVRGTWLVLLGPLTLTEEGKRSLLAILAREGFSPMSLTTEKRDEGSAGGRQRLWQWGVLGLLTLVGGWFVWRRFGQARLLSGRQQELEERQTRLERGIEEGERRHG